MNARVRENLVEALLDHFGNIGGWDLVQLHNVYCEAANYNDDRIFQNEDDFFVDFFTIEELRRQLGGNTDYRYNDDFVKYDGCGNIESFNKRDLDNHVDIGEMVEYIVENDDDLEDSDIRDILNDHDLDEDDDEETED